MAASDFHINQRLSYTNSLCTVRYIGTVEGTSGEWLGVEWDEPARGKHSGEYGGKKYFDCIIPNAGSFIRPTRAVDPTLSFVQALRKKYIDTGDEDKSNPANRPIEWGGKVVEEIGFDKIRQQLRQLHSLRIVLIDGLQIDKADSAELIQSTCPNIEELDLSRNRFESLQEVSLICRNLQHLKRLRLSGNRIASVDLDLDPENPVTGFDTITNLELEETLLTWEQLSKLLPYFPSVKSIDLSLNRLSTIPLQLGDVQLSTIFPPKLDEIKLERNLFTSLGSLAPLTKLETLKKLILAHNNISITYNPDEPSLVFPDLKYLDLSFNNIPSFTFIDALNAIFPQVEGLRISHNPVYHTPGMSSEEAHFLTVGRLGWKVRLLNFSTITMQERTNAELYYISKIVKEMAEVPPEREHEVTQKHSRWPELLKLHGRQYVIRNPDQDKQSLGRNLIKIEFVQSDTNIINKKIPKSLSVSALKGAVGKLFDTKPLQISLKIVFEPGKEVLLEDELRRLDHYVEDKTEVRMLVEAI